MRSGWQSESELGILDLIQVTPPPRHAIPDAAHVVCSCGQVFVEALDKSFENVCELDLIFHTDKVRASVCSSSCLSYDRRCTLCWMKSLWLAWCWRHL